MAVLVWKLRPGVINIPGNLLILISRAVNLIKKLQELADSISQMGVIQLSLCAG